MHMRKLFTIGLFVFASIAFGQQKLKMADKMFKSMSYVEAAKLYEEYLEKNASPSIETITNVADTYYFTNDMRKALPWYKKLYEIQGQNLTDLYMLRYTQTLRGVRDYDQANGLVKEYLKKKAVNGQVKQFANNQAHLDSLAKKETLYEIRNLEVNTPNSDFGTAYYGDKMIYSSTYEDGATKLYSWNQQPFLAMFVAEKNLSNGSLFNQKLFLNEINSDYHDATITFTQDLKTFYYTTNTLNKKKLKNDADGTNNFQIIKAWLENDKVTKTENLFFNSLDYSVGHPSLSADGKWLFFVSDMPGGFGETDIYVCEVFEDGKLNSPKNLGPKINSVGREMFPYYSNGVLYFSSEGHYGFGGLDVFESKFNGKDFSYPKNLGEPINSNKDDFSYIIDADLKTGYFSSNRETGKGDDDIYYFTKKIPACSQIVQGTVKNSKTQVNIDGATIKVYDEFGDLVNEFTSTSDGKFEFELPCNGSYKVEVAKPNHTTEKKEIATLDKNGDIINLDFKLTSLDDLVVKDKVTGDEKVDINTIFFNYNKWDITPQAATELDKVVFVMNNFPKVTIRIESHTDSRGKDLYNLTLSDKRAKSTQAYILSKGIAAERIESAVGFGETRLRNKCSNGVKCTEEEHFVNRRSDFIIVTK